MTVRMVAPPATFPVTVAEAKLNMRVAHDEDDTTIDGLIKAALAYVENSTGRAFEPQTWELTIDRFPAGEIMLPVGPVVSVTSVVYADELGVAQTVPADDYETDLSGADGWIIPIAGWPVAMTTVNAVKVTFIAGYGTPPDVRQAILLIVAFWYDNRATATAPSMTEIPYGAEAMISLHRRIYI